MKPRIVCLTPVRNEAWILHEFLTAASVWADDIIVADQGSTDGSLEIAARFPRVIVVGNSNCAYNESQRQQLLIAASRRLSGQRILVALDADEFLSPALADPNVIRDLLVPFGPGALIRVPWMNVESGLRTCWVGHRNFIAAWFDNGREHKSHPIHAQRLPVNHEDPLVRADSGASVLHWQYTARERMRSKHRWYLAWERIYGQNRDPIQLYRQYHHMDAIPQSCMLTIPPEWIEWYRSRGVELVNIRDDGLHWWDHQVLAWMEQYGSKFFARDGIWTLEWQDIARRLGYKSTRQFSDPRNAWQRLVQLWLRRTQRSHRTLWVRTVDRALRPLV